MSTVVVSKAEDSPESASEYTRHPMPTSILEPHNLGEGAGKLGRREGPKEKPTANPTQHRCMVTRGDRLMSRPFH